MKICVRVEEQWQPFCDWCGINVGAWYPVRRAVLQTLARHRRLHREQGRMGQSIRAVDFP